MGSIIRADQARLDNHFRELFGCASLMARTLLFMAWSNGWQNEVILKCARLLSSPSLLRRANDDTWTANREWAWPSRGFAPRDATLDLRLGPSSHRPFWRK